jgi:hypothetical protein
MDRFRNFLRAYEDFYHDKDVRKFLPAGAFAKFPSPEELSRMDVWELSKLADDLSSVLDVAQGIAQVTENALDLLDEVSAPDLDPRLS